MTEKEWKCSQCGKKALEKNLFIIDNHRICNICLYGEAKPFEIFPIGYVENNLTKARKGFGTIGDKTMSVINLMQSQHKFMYKLEEEKYLIIIYYLHESRSVASIFKRGLDGKEVGVFASRTPGRLSRIGVRDVELLKIEGNKIYVKGLDAINGSPVLDIKLKI